MQIVELDGRNWSVADDIYLAFFAAVGAPTWHGHNFNALRDSISVGQINAINVPYNIRIKNYSAIGAGAKEMASNFVHLIEELRESGCPVGITIEN